jgi:hypothetical protein
MWISDFRNQLRFSNISGFFIYFNLSEISFPFCLLKGSPMVLFFIRIFLFVPLIYKNLRDKIRRFYRQHKQLTLFRLLSKFLATLSYSQSYLAFTKLQFVSSSLFLGKYLVHCWFSLLERRITIFSSFFLFGPC